MNWDTEFAISIIPQLVGGLIVTVQAVVIGYAVALVLGLLVAVLRRIWGIGPVVFAVFEFIRTTPVLVQLLFVFALAPKSFTPLTIGISVLGVHYAAYTAEVYRSGIEGVARGQWEACRALSMPPMRVWGAVVLPQAIRRVLPALGNYFISMFKDTPYLFAITVPEMMFVAKAIGTESFRSMEAYTLAGLFFLAVSVPSAVIIRRLERRYAAV